MRLLVALVSALLLGPACGGSGEAVLEYEGTPGQPVPLDLSSLVPVVDTTIDGQAARFLVDTGAPITVLDTTAFPERAAGKHTVDIGAFGLSFPDYSVAALDLFPGGTASFGGILGGDLLRHFAFSIDYQGARGWLWDPFDPQVPVDGIDAAATASVPVDVAGGGAGRLSGCSGDCSVRIPPTRVVTRAILEESGEDVWVLVDSGASAVVVSRELLAALDRSASGRPRLDGVTVSTIDGPQSAFLTRVWRLRLVGLGAGDAAAGVDDLPVLVLPTSELFENVSAEVGRPVEVLIGGTYLRYFFTTFDYPAEHLHLAAYTNPAHVSPDEFVGVGFTLERVGDEWRVADVYVGTDAELDGLTGGDVVEEIGSMPIRGQPAAVVDDLLDDYGLGQDVPVGVIRGTQIETLLIQVEDLLPSYPPP